MPKRVIFHVGLPKTGTTTIQHYLRNHDEELRSLGFLYPGPKDHPAMSSHKHLLILRDMLGKSSKPKNKNDNTCREIIAHVFAEFRASDFKNLVWSNEGFAARGQDLDIDYVQNLLNGFEVRIVFFARYIDDWLESYYKERIRGRAGASVEKRKPMLLPAPQEGAHASGSRRVKSALGVASEISGSLRAMRNVVPSAEVVVRSFDADRERGTVVSGALAAMGLPVDNAISNPDDDADVYNASDSTPVKSDRYSMLLFHLLIGEAEPDVIRSVKTALKAKDAQGLEFAPLSGRRFRFLSEQNINQARGYYEDLRNEYPHLPSQSPYAPDPAERSLPKRDGVALLDWLRPEISDAIFEKACAAYTLI